MHGLHCTSILFRKIQKKKQKQKQKQNKTKKTKKKTNEQTNEKQTNERKYKQTQNLNRDETPELPGNVNESKVGKELEISNNLVYHAFSNFSKCSAQMNVRMLSDGNR